MENNNNNNQPKQPKVETPKQNNPVNPKPVQKNYKLKENTGNQVADFAAGLWNKSIDNQPKQAKQPKQKKLTDSNPFRGTNIPGFENMESTWDDLMGSGQKVVDNGKALKQMGLEDNDLDDDALINRSVDNLIKFAKKSYGDKRNVEDLRGIVNKEWSEDLAYQLKNDGVPEEKIQGLVKKFVDSAPTREEVNDKILNQMGLDDEDKINDDIYDIVNSNSKWFDDYASKNKIQDEDDFYYMIDEFIDTKLPEQYRNIPDLHDKVVDWFNNMKDWEENGGDYKAALKQMGLDNLDNKDFGDSNGSNKTSWSALHNPTPEQENQLNQIFNSVFPGKDWKYIIDNVDSPRDVNLGIEEFLETGHSEYLLNVLKSIKKRYDDYRVKI